jgi:hypothetical protein
MTDFFIYEEAYEIFVGVKSAIFKEEKKGNAFLLADGGCQFSQ